MNEDGQIPARIGCGFVLGMIVAVGLVVSFGPDMGSVDSIVVLALGSIVVCVLLAVVYGDRFVERVLEWIGWR